MGIANTRLNESPSFYRYSNIHYHVRVAVGIFFKLLNEMDVDIFNAFLTNYSIQHEVPRWRVKENLVNNLLKLPFAVKYSSGSSFMHIHALRWLVGHIALECLSFYWESTPEGFMFWNAAVTDISRYFHHWLKFNSIQTW